ncbi:MAG: pyridoxamine 5'-phosphate oxidase family protein, partial [Flavitalea sp.]
NWKSMISWGRFEEITDPEQRKNAIKRLNERTIPISASQTVHLSELWPFSYDQAEVHGIVYRIRLTKKTGKFEEDIASPDTDMPG